MDTVALPLDIYCIVVCSSFAWIIVTMLLTFHTFAAHIHDTQNIRCFWINILCDICYMSIAMIIHALSIMFWISCQNQIVHLIGWFYFARSYVSELVGQKEDCDQVIRDVSQVLGHLQELRQRYVHVSTKTNALHEACENLLEEQVKYFLLSITFFLTWHDVFEYLACRFHRSVLALISDLQT